MCFSLSILNVEFLMKEFSPCLVLRLKKATTFVNKVRFSNLIITCIRDALTIHCAMRWRGIPTLF
jgi:hypothetical protein